MLPYTDGQTDRQIEIAKMMTTTIEAMVVMVVGDDDDDDGADVVV